MESALIYVALFAVGITFGIPLGRIATVNKLGPIIRQMSTRILELEEQVVALISSKDEVKTLERWMRN